KARHRIERLVALLGVQQVAGAQARELRLHSLGDLAQVPGRVVDPLQELGAAVLAEPAPESRHRGERGEAPQVRKLALQLLGDLLYEQVAERYAAQPLLAVGDRVEHRA